MAINEFGLLSIINMFGWFSNRYEELDGTIRILGCVGRPGILESGQAQDKSECLSLRLVCIILIRLLFLLLLFSSRLLEAKDVRNP